MILFDDVDQTHHPVLVAGDGKAHSVGRGVIGKVLAAASGVAAIAQIALRGFGRFIEVSGVGVASAMVGIAQRQPRRVNPGAFIQPAHGHEKRACHSGILTLLEPSRIEILQQLLAQNPASSFARYGLAMEYVKSGDFGRAAVEFDAVLAVDPAYSAAYFHGGQTLEKLGRLEDARDYYRRGIDATRDPHARSELEAALDILGD